MRLPLAAIALTLVACSTTPPAYDPSAQEMPARITEKRIIGSISRATAEVKFDAIIPVGKLLVPMSSPDNKANIPIYEYNVTDKHQKITKVLSESSIFEVGQCVKLFISNQPTYPRIAYGAECNEF